MQLHTRARRIIRWAALSLFTVLGFLAVVGWAESHRNTDEEYAVYSAYLSDGLLNDAHDWSTGGPIQVVIADATVPGGSLRFRALYALDNRAQFDQLKFSARASYLLRNIFSAPITQRFSLPKRATVALTHEPNYGSAEFQTKFPRNMGLVVLSGVGFDTSHTQAVFYIDHFCGLCGGGAYIFMEKVDGNWRVVDQHGTWIS
jgi:hypothetical protein